jgi:hypothetical protein
MSRETTYKGILGDWEQLHQILVENSAELPHLEASRVKLEGFLKQGLEIAAKQSMLRAEKQDASQRMKVLIVDGQRLANVLRLSVREHLGIRSEKLVAFGVPPFRGRKPSDKSKKAKERKQTEKPEQPASTPAEPSPSDPAS